MSPPSKTRTQKKARETLAEAKRCQTVATISPDDSCSEDPCSNTLLLAVAEQNLEKLAECIANGHDLHDTPLKGCTPLLLAVKLGNSEMVKLLLENGATCSADENGTTMLHHAAVNGFTEVVNALVLFGAAVVDQQNAAGCTPLYQAVQHGHTECVCAFLAMGADVEARTRTGATPLYIASDRGYLNLANRLLDAGSNANIATALQMTPLLVAAFNGHQNVVHALISRKVDIEQRGPCGGTALYVAAQEGKRSVAEYLLQQGAKVDARCDGDLTPSLIAAMQGHDGIVRLLLEAKAELGVRTEKGSTLAIMAARHGQTNVLQTLVEVGGSTVLDGHNTEGLSALGAAKVGRHTETMSYIKKVNAEQKNADLNAWEASLPGILQELDPSCKKKKKTKSKSKAKVNGRCVGRSIGDAAAAGSPESATHVEDVDLEDAPTLGADREAAAVQECSAGDEACNAEDEGNPLAVEECKRLSDNQDSVVGPWMQVKRKGIVRPMLAIAPPESPALSAQQLPAAMQLLSPMATLTPCPMLLATPTLHTPGPVTPMSAHPSTPCGTTSPFGLRAVLPPWPATPEFWPSLPPAMNPIADTFPEKMFSGALTQHCQSMFMAPWMSHHFAPIANFTGQELN